MRLSLPLFIGLRCLIVSVAPAASEKKDCVTHCGPNKCKSDQFCQVLYEQSCLSTPKAPKYTCVKSKHASYQVKYSRTKGPANMPYFYRTDTFSNCKKGHGRSFTWKWPAQLAETPWIQQYFDPFLRFYEGSDVDLMYMWRGCQCGMKACPDYFEISSPQAVVGLQVGDDTLIYQFSCRMKCDDGTKKQAQDNITLTKGGTVDKDGDPFLKPVKDLCTKDASPPPTTRTTPPQAQVDLTCSGMKTAPPLLEILLVAAAFLLF